MACPSFALIAWKRAFVSRMYRHTMRSSFIGAVTLYFGFLTSVSCTPFCQLWNFHGPLDTGIEFKNMSFMSLPLMTCAAYGPAPAYASQSANWPLNTIVALLPFAFTDFMSSQPVRSSMLNFGLMFVSHVCRKSSPTTGLPSLQTALGL